MSFFGSNPTSSVVRQGDIRNDIPFFNYDEYDSATEAVNKVADNYHRPISKKLAKDEVLEKRQLVVQKLLMSLYIKSAVLFSDNATIWITFNSGMETFIIFELIKKNNKSDKGAMKQKSENNHDLNYDKKLTPDSKPQTINSIEMFQPMAIKKPKQIGVIEPAIKPF